MGERADLPFSPGDRRALLNLARATLEACVRGDADPILADFLEKSPEGAPWLQPYPCFVTLFSRGDRLRGCIGCLETENSLAENVHHFTQLSALHDPRFKPVRPEETPKLEIHISVLGPLSPLGDIRDIILGRHGLSVERGAQRGVLLATVATQNGWSKERFLQETFRKAGLDPAQRDGAQISSFEQIEFDDSDPSRD